LLTMALGSHVRKSPLNTQCTAATVTAVVSVQVREFAVQKNIDYRTAAFAIAIDKIATAYKELGIFP
jgi:hypothetical protein